MDNLPEKILDELKKQNINSLRPAQEKAINSGLIDFNNLLVCTPTASGKTLIAEIAFLNHMHNNKGKAVYVVPLKALANEKYKEFKAKYSSKFKIAISIGDFDSSDSYLENYDLILTTSEKLDSLIRHNSNWLKQISLLIVDEIHLLNDFGRGPTLEIVITILKMLNPGMQLVGLSATIGNPRELGDWLDAELVEDDWRPIPLKKGIFLDKLYFP